MRQIDFERSVIERIQTLVNIHFSLPILYDLTGGNFESFFAESIDGRRETRKLLFDVIKGEVGWSLKTLQSKSEDKFEVVLKRCNVIKKDFVWQTDDAQVIGDAILDNFTEFYNKSVIEQSIRDSRICIMLVHKESLRFRIFQADLEIQPKETVIWEFSKLDKNGKLKDEVKSIIGKIDGRVVYRWYRSGTQLFGVYDVPEKPNEFLAKPRDISMQVLEEAFRNAPTKSRQLIRQQMEQLNSQLGDIENDNSQ